MSHLNFDIFANFLSFLGSGFQKLAKVIMAFLMNFCLLKM